MSTAKVRRSPAWWGAMDRDGFIHRSWMKNQGLPDDLFEGRPVIGICNSWSELTPCNAHLRRLAEWVKRGVWEAGGFPLEFPTMSLGEPLMRPTTMLFRNLMSMDVEESLRANPLDGVVLLCGCDKTTPAQLMGAASVNLPTILLTGGPMLNGRFKGQQMGSGTDAWRLSEEVRAGKLSLDAFLSAEAGNSRSQGHCNTMGTASTMASMAEALGVSLTGAAAIPGADSRRFTYAHLTGRRIVDMVHEKLSLNKILTRDAFQNAICTNAAIGGSTNAVVHLLALAGRIGVDLALEDFDRWGSDLPLLCNLQPSGEHLMEDFYYAGGLPVVMKEISSKLVGTAMTVTGKQMAENIASAECYNRDVIYSSNKPLQNAAGIAVLRGNLAPQGAVIKPSAATQSLLTHKGRAVVFESIEDFKARVDDPNLDVDPSCVLVLKGAGPKGYPGMAEVGNLPLPAKILKQGVTDMVRVSDARMSGTAYGTVVLHTAPEAAVGGPLGLVRNNDVIVLDVPNRKLQLEVDDGELAERRLAWKAPERPAVQQRGYARLYVDHVLQADAGVDFDFLVGNSGAEIPRENH